MQIIFALHFNVLGKARVCSWLDTQAFKKKGACAADAAAIETQNLDKQ